MQGNSKHQDYLSARKVLNLPEDETKHDWLIGVAEKVVGISKINTMMSEFGPPWPDADQMIDLMFEKLNIKWSIENPEILENLNDTPKIFVANHPYGLPDAFALFKLLTKYRPEVKLFANKLLAATQLDERRLLYVDPFAAADSRGQNRKSIATALKHLRSGGDLALFPGRICSHLKTSDWTISDSEWTDQVRRFVEVSGGEMVPLHISGRNSMLFNMSGLIHPRIRTYMLLREFLRGGHDFKFTIGNPVPASQLSKISNTVSIGTFARSMVYGLKTGSKGVPDIPQLIEPSARTEFEEKIIIEAPKKADVKATLEAQQLLFEQGDYKIYMADKNASDALMDIICDVRFRAYQSETNVKDPSELRDGFDQHYNHLLLWDKKAERMVGVYRYTLPDPENVAVTSETLVTNSIFDLAPDFRKLLPKSMELGRAAILPEYQKNYMPLMLLWRAILEVAKLDKNIKYLFGPVTMGQNFSPISRELVRRHIMEYYQDGSMEGFIKPKRSLNFEIPREVNLDTLSSACNSFSKLGNLINGFEGGQRNLPVLFRHYAQVGCKYVGFGEWKELDNATAGLTMLDLKDINKNLLVRYFGNEGAAAFQAGR